MSDRLGVLRDPAYRRFWLGESISFVGSHVTDLALPLTAVLILHAAPEQMGFLTALSYVPFLLFGLLAGVWVDRMRRRPILVATDLVCAGAIALIPAAAVVGGLRIEVLYLVAFVVGAAGEVIAPVAYQSFLPTLVGREQLIEGNARLEASHSVATIVGPSIGGFLVQLLTAPIALVMDALSYVASAVLVGTIRVDEPPPAPSDDRPSIRDQVREGLAIVAATPILRSLVMCGSIHNFFSRMLEALFVLYAVTTVGLGPAEIGLVLAAGGPGSLLGAVAVGRLGDRVGVGRLIAACQVLTGISRLIIPVAALVGGGWAAVAVLAGSTLLLGFARTVFNITQVSLRVAITEERMHGRVNGTVRFVMWSVTPFGAVMGGLLAGSALGLEGTLILAGVGVLVATLPLLAPGIRRVRTIPARVA